jgi:phosphoribosyl-ATP pyrophosphohydrolase/phosphoribosyl-AMP cyclohydrolase
MKEVFEHLKFDEKGLIPAVVQDVRTKDVLMVAYMNKEALQKTVKTNETWFYSRSRQKLWHKGEISGNIQKVKEIKYDCDGDTLLVLVEQKGVACHTGKYSCFFNDILKGDSMPGFGIINKLRSVIKDRKEKRPEGSYTAYLFDEGLDKILKKVGEEASEVIIASKNEDRNQLIYEIADLLYHMLVLMEQKEIKTEEILEELQRRFKT